MLRKLILIFFLITLPLSAQQVDVTFDGLSLGDTLGGKSRFKIMPSANSPYYPYVQATVQGGALVKGDSTVTPGLGVRTKFSAYLFDSLLIPPFEVRVVLGGQDPEIGGNATDRYIASIWMTPDNTSPLGTSSPQQNLIVARYGAGGNPATVKMRLTSTGYAEQDGQPWGQTAVGNNLNPSTQTQWPTSLSSTWTTNDTLVFRFYPDTVISIGLRAVSGTLTDTAYANSQGSPAAVKARFESMATNGGYVGLSFPLRDSTQEFSDDNQVGVFRFTIWDLSDTTTPAAVADTTSAVAGTITFAPPNPYVGNTTTATFNATDDYGIATMRIEADTVGNGTFVLAALDAEVGGTLSDQLAASLSLSTADTIWVRGIVTDTAGNTPDTSSVFTVVYRNQVSVGTEKIIYGYLTFPSDIDLRGPNPGVGSLGGRMPVDSLPWDALTHASFFAADVNSDGTWNNGGNGPAYLYKMPYVAAEAHKNGVYAGFCFGGAGDVGIRAAMSDLNAHDNLLATCLDLIDNKGQDFIDFDIEGSTWDETNATIFLRRLDSAMQLRQSYNNPLKSPFIVLTVGAGVALGARGDVLQMEPYIEILNIMSYDKAGSWWGQVPHDCAITSWSNWDGSGTNVTPMNYANQGGKAFPSMQEEARLLKEGGWPPEKIVMGMDLNPTYLTGGTFSDGRGPNYPGKVWSASPSFSGSGRKFFRDWGEVKWNQAMPYLKDIPADSIFVDNNAHVVWAHVGDSLANDFFISQIMWPGINDSAYVWADRVVDSMGIGGFMIWGLTETYGTSLPAPTGGWAWASNTLSFYFGGVIDTVTPACPPPAYVGPANSATGTNLSTLLQWNSSACGDSFYVQVDTSGQSFANPKYAVTLVDTFYSAVLDSGVTYQWRVARKNAGVLGSYAAVRSFTTKLKYPSAVTLISPTSNQTNVSTTTTHTWTYGGASTTSPLTAFHIQADTVSNSWGALLYNDTTVGASLREYVGQYDENDTIYWRMRAKNATGWGPWTSGLRFYTLVGLPSAPIIVRPARNSTTEPADSMLVQWSGAGIKGTSYQVQISTASSFNTVVKDTAKTVNPLNSADFSMRIFGLQDSTQYYIRMRGSNAGGYGPWALAVPFSTGIPVLQIPRATVQMNLYYDIVTGNWVWNTPSRWLMYYDSDPTMADIPTPQDTLQVAWSPYGVKTKDTTLLYNLGDAIYPRASVLKDSLNGDTLSAVVLNSAVSLGALRFDNPLDTSSRFYLIPNDRGSRIGGTYTELPSIDGEIVVSNPTQSNPQFNSIELNVPLQYPYGGTGIGTSAVALLGPGTYVYTVDKYGGVGDEAVDPNFYSVGSLLNDAGAARAPNGTPGQVPVVGPTGTVYQHTKDLTDIRLRGHRLYDTTLVANQDLHNLLVSKAVSNIVFSGTLGASVTLNVTGVTDNGISGADNGRIITMSFWGSDAGDSVVVKHEDANSTAANRFKLPGAADVVLYQDYSATFIYDAVALRWRLLSKNF